MYCAISLIILGWTGQNLIFVKSCEFSLKYPNKILFEFENLTFQSRLIEGIYPKYQQLIPAQSERKIVIDKMELNKKTKTPQ